MSKLLYKTVKFIKEECEEAWKVKHEEVMISYRNADCLEDAAQLYGGLYAQVKCAIEGDAQESFDSIVSWCETLDLWYDATGGLLAMIEESELADFPVDGAATLRENHRDASRLLEDLHDAKNAIEAIADRRSKGVQEFLDELRNPIHR